MKCFFCGADGQSAHEECTNCKRVVNLRNYDTPITPRIRKPGSPKKPGNTTVFFGFLAVAAVIVVGTVMRPTRLSGLFATGNPYYSSREIVRIRNETDDPYYFGLTAGKRQRPDAVKWFQTCAGGPRAAESLYHLGILSLLERNSPGARKLFEESLGVNPDFANPKFYLQGVSADNLFDTSALKIPQAGSIRVFKRLWEVHRLYVRVWTLVVTGSQNQQEIFNLSSPPISAPNKVEDVLVYGRVGRFDLRSVDGKTTLPGYGSFIKRTSMIQVRVPLKSSEDFVVSFQAPYFIGVNPNGPIDVTALSVPGAETVSELFAFPKGSDIVPDTHPDMVSSPPGWEIYGYTVTGAYRQIKINARTAGRKTDLDGLTVLGFSRSDR